MEVQIKDLVLVKIYFEDSPVKDEIVLRKDLMKYIKAIVKLHVSPGINPHNGLDTAKVHQIDCYNLLSDGFGSFWWTSPDLHDMHNGAKIALHWNSFRRYTFNKFLSRYLLQLCKVQSP